MHANRVQWGLYSDARLELLRDHHLLNHEGSGDDRQDDVDLFISSTPALSDDQSTASYIFGARPIERAEPPSLPPSLSLPLSPHLSSPPLGMHTASLPPGLSHTMSRRNSVTRKSRRQSHIAHFENQPVSPTRGETGCSRLPDARGDGTSRPREQKQVYPILVVWTRELFQRAASL